VLKPGGRAVISDIRHMSEYESSFKANGCSDVRLVESKAASILVTVLTMGSLRPNTMVAQKAA
jgi:hypothetical protein